MAPAIAAVTIGQSPRPDLLEPLLARLPAGVEVIEVGALDPVAASELARRRKREGWKSDPYPLSTRLRDGTQVTLDESELSPLVQAAIHRGEGSSVAVTLLLCAGGFLAATARGPLVRPFDAAVDWLRSTGARRIAVVVPFEDQAEPAQGKWLAAGFEPTLLVGDPATLVSPATGVDAIVLDYVGHSSASVEALRSRASTPVVDLGACGADAAARYFDHHGGTPHSGAS